MASVRGVCALVLTLLATGCGLLGGEEGGAGPEEAGLAAYEGKGLRAGYPKGWTTPAKDRRLFPGADFEAAAPGGAGGLPGGTIAVLVMRKEQSVRSLADHYAALVKTRRDGRLVSRREAGLGGGHTAQVLDRTYSVSLRGGRVAVRQVDVLVRVGTREIADVRLLYPQSAYDAARPEIDKITSAIEVTGLD